MSAQCALLVLGMDAAIIKWLKRLSDAPRHGVRVLNVERATQ